MIKKCCFRSLAVAIFVVLLSDSISAFLPARVTNFEPMVAIKCGHPILHLRRDPRDATNERNIWMRDDGANDCMDTEKTKTMVWHYCKQVYSEMDVTNVMEGEEISITGWCEKGHTSCPHDVTVGRSWRCLVGPFQSDALLVPDGCHFNHLHLPQDRKDAFKFLQQLSSQDSAVDAHLEMLAKKDAAAASSKQQRTMAKFLRTCLDFQFWNVTARASCRSTYGMDTFSFSPLLPCGIDEFVGVEYVCCPKEKMPHHKMTDKQPHMPMPSIHDGAKPVKPTKREDKKAEKPHLLGHWGEQQLSSSSSSSPAAAASSSSAAAEAIVPAHYRNEHERFLDEERSWKQKYEETVSRIVKDFTNARMQVQEMRSKGDIKGAEKLNREINARYKKTYDAVEAEGAAEKKQIVARHQARVDAQLNDRKRKAMEELNSALTSSKPQPKKILRSIITYVKAEEKDRIHIINRYQHLRNTNPEEADRVHTTMTDRLANIDRRIQSYLARVDSLPANVAKEIRPEIDELLQSYEDVDEDEHLMMEEIKDDLSPSADDILAKFQEEAMRKKEEEEIQMRKIEEANRVKALKEKEKRKLVDQQAAAMINNMNKDIVEDKEDEEEFEDEEEESDEDDDQIDDEDDNEEEHNGNAPPGLVRVKLNRDDTMTKVKLFDPETMENEQDLKEEKPEETKPAVAVKTLKASPYVAHMSSSEFAHHREAEVREAVLHARRSQQKTGSVTGLLAAGAGIFLVLVVAIVILRKKKAPRQPLNTGFVEVDAKGFTPEERHVHNMQMNGYENPTYRYFEMST